MSAKPSQQAAEPSELSILGLLADIRAAVGDPSGRLMQDELVEHCRRIYGALSMCRDALKTAMDRADSPACDWDVFGDCHNSALDAMREADAVLKSNAGAQGRFCPEVKPDE